MKLRVGIVGISDAWENRHRPALRSLADRFEVRAVCAEVKQRADQIAHEFRAVSVDGFRTLAARPDLDAILVLGSGFYGPLPYKPVPSVPGTANRLHSGIYTCITFGVLGLSVVRAEIKSYFWPQPFG